MTAVQLNALNTELWQGIGSIADSEPLMKRLAKYVKRLVKEKEADSTEMSREEFFRRVDEGREQIRRGEGIKMLPNENLEDFLKRVG